MKKVLPFLYFIFLVQSNIVAQQKDSNDHIELMPVIIKAFEQNKKLKDVPASIGYVNQRNLERFNSASIVQAVNTVPGVRMEERSPGSYRFNIRGSSLRSPFGVRNVKVYYNDLPLTDPGGQTYLNALGNYNFNTMEFIKGPGSSLYGAGTGGVLLIDALNDKKENGFFTEYTMGSYDLHNAYASYAGSNDQSKNKIGFQHQQSDGYRQHSALRRDVLSWSGNYHLNVKGFLKTSFLYSDLFYNTPGALNLNEYIANSKAARPASGGFPGAEQANAAIFKKTFLAGASYMQQLSTDFSNKTIAYGAYTKLLNPTIRNYSRNAEPHVGGRTIFTYNKSFSLSSIAINAGAEIQQGFASFSIHKNINGNADSLQSFDEVNNRLLTTFAQVIYSFQNWEVSAGASLNWMRIRFYRFAPTPMPEQLATFNNQLAPRFSLMYKFKTFNVYSSIAKGFSPPTTAELLPTGSAINLDLFAEDGINYEAGAKGKIIDALTFDISAFLFRLKNTIVQRRDAGGGDYFINAGKTNQYGIETALNYPLFQNTIFTYSNLWASYAWQHFKYKDFKQLSFDYSGKYLPGVAPLTIATGYEVEMQNGFMGNINYYYSDAIPLNDMNTDVAKAYHLLSIKVGFQQWIKSKVRIKIIAGAENLLNQKYSLGNDINAFGGRYYNAAPKRNYYVSLSFQLKGK